MFKQTPIPSESDLRAALGDDYEDRWDHDKVSLWLQEKGWGHIAATFREHGIRGKEFFTITLSQLVDILPRPVTTYAERRRLLSEIRALGTPVADASSPALKTPANISINTNVHQSSYHQKSSSSSAGVDLPSGGTPTSAQLPDTASPSTPLSLSRFDCVLEHPKDSGYQSRHSAGISSTSSSPSSSEFPLGMRSPGNRNSPTHPYSPKTAFSKIRLNLMHNHAPSTLTPSTTGPLISPRISSMHYDAAAFTSESDDKAKQISATTFTSANRTPDKISKLWAAYSQWRYPGSSSRANNSNINSNSNNININNNFNHNHQNNHIIKKNKNHATTPSSSTTDHHQSKRPPSALAQHRRQSDQRIQVTGDMETWYSLVVTDVRDAEVAKDMMLKRMQLQGHPSDYYFFHENGLTPDKPLTCQEILALCLVADYTATQRILVKPVYEFIYKEDNNAYQQSRLAPPVANHDMKAPSLTDFHYLQSQYENYGNPQQQRLLPYGNSVFSMSTPELGHSPSDTYSPRYIEQTLKPPSPRSPGYPSTKLVDTRNTSESIGVRLCDPPTPGNAEAPLEEPAAYDRPRKGSVPFIHEASKPSKSAVARRSEPMLAQSAAALWPTDSSPHPDQCSSCGADDTSLHPPAQLWAVPPATVRKKKDEKRYWGERPPADVVCQNMDQYFDDHDLDKEIVVEQPCSRRYTKSIRVVAREASQKYRRKDTNIVRRKSTKLWGQRVVEVKPGLQSVKEQVSMNMTHCHDSKKPVQWIRGKFIGKGSFGRVYLAFNVATGEVIAVKQVEVGSKLNPNASEVEDALYQEIAMLQDLDHDHIVQYLGYGRDDSEGVVNIFLEYVSGGSIASRLALHGGLEESVVRHFTRQICLGIAYLHSKNILHRDIKAANILVEADGVCKISDFGLSKKNDYDEVYDQNSRMSLRGSVYWMAPEVVKNEPYSAKVDIWSLGCTVIEMFTGQRPWLTLNQIAALYSLGCQKHPDIPKDISDTAKDFIRLCFIVDPKKRPTATALLKHPFCTPDPSFKFTDYVDKGKI